MPTHKPETVTIKDEQALLMLENLRMLTRQSSETLVARAIVQLYELQRSRRSR